MNDATALQPVRVLETCLYAEDLVAAETFYGDLIGLEFFARDPKRHVFFRCSNQMVLIFDPRATLNRDRDVPTHGATGPGHVAFRVALADLDGWRRRLAASGVAIEHEVTWSRGGNSLYFRDPAGNSVELVAGRIWGVEDQPGT